MGASRLGVLRARETDHVHRAWVALATCILAVGTGCVTETVGPAYYDPDQHRDEQAVARRDLGMDYLGTGRTAMALRELEFAYSVDPGDPVTNLWLGEGYRRRNKLGKAVEFMERAVEIKPSYHEARLNLSALYLQLERYEQAIMHSQILVDDALYSEPWKAANNLGWAQFKLGRLEAARLNFELALDFRRDYWPALLNLGILEETQGRRYSAIRNYEKVLARGVRMQPGSETNFRLAKVYVAMGERAKAISHFEAAVEEDPEGKWADQSRDYLALLQ